MWCYIRLVSFSSMKHLLLIPAFYSFAIADAQNYNLLLKKHSKTIDQFWKGSMIAFQLKNESWMHGEVINIHPDSIFVKPLMIQYSFMHADTLPSFVTGFAIKDIYAFPKPGVMIDYDKGNFRVNRKGSSVKAYWLKSGYILRVGALGYAALNIINSLSKDELSIENNGTELAIAAAVLAAGLVLDKTYKPKYIIRKKYHLELLNLSKE